MTFISEKRQDYVGAPIAAGRPSMWSHIQTSVEATRYDLPMQNIMRSIDLQHADQNFHDISAEEANERFGIAGHVSFEKPISWRKAELINQFKREELERFQTIELGNDTLIRKSAFFASSFVGQAFDPINLAAMFIPVVGEARFAALVGKVGLTKARAIAGATEALVGQALIEPTAYLSKMVGEQNVYGWRDTLANTTMGTLMGTALRVGGGRLKDKVVTLMDGADPKWNLDVLEQQIFNEAEKAARAKKLVKGTPEYKSEVVKQVGILEEFHRSALEMKHKQIETANLVLKETPDYVHRRAFEESINNIINDEPVAGPELVIKLAEIEQVRSDMSDNWSTKKSDIETKPVSVESKVDDGVTAVNEGTQHKLNGTKVHEVVEDGTIHLNIAEHGDDVDLQAIVFGAARRALDEGLELVVAENGTSTKLDAEALNFFVHGEDAVAKVPEVQEAPKGLWEDAKISEDQPDVSTPNKLHDSNVKTADEINAQADQILEQMAKDLGKAKDELTPDEIEAGLKKTEVKPETKKAFAEEAARAEADLNKEFASMLDKLDIPENVKQQMIDDFEAPNRLADEQAGIETAVDCVIRSLT
jgi:hypothetical protein